MASHINTDLFSPFRSAAPWWGPDLQTIRNTIMLKLDRIPVIGGERMVFVMDEAAGGAGDRLLARLSVPGKSAAKNEAKPLVILIHGLTGCEDSAYVRRTARWLLSCGYPVLRLNKRGAGPSRDFCRQQYHAGRSEDLGCILRQLDQVIPEAVMKNGVVLLGYSLGANMMLKFLGEQGRRATGQVRAAVSISAPIRLKQCCEAIMRTRNAPYHKWVIERMRRESLGAGQALEDHHRRAIMAARTTYEFDDLFVAPFNGFSGAEDYYARNSAEQFLDDIAVPTLVIHALDDPWIPADPYRQRDWSANPGLTALLPEAGGHVGFHASGLQGRSWADDCTTRFLDEVLRHI